MGRIFIQLLAITKKHQSQRLRSGILALSTVILAVSAGLVKAEQPQVKVDDTVVSETYQSGNNVLSNAVPNAPMIPKNNDLKTDPPLAQMKDVPQLTDVTSQDKAYKPLNNLIKRYKCISPYPDGTFKGNLALTRDEFASILNTCLQKNQDLINTHKE
jgi:hypothetical protein